MRVEQRRNRRKLVNVNAIIFHRPLGLLRATVCDVSLKGAFVETGRIVLPRQAVVELSFALETGGKPQLYQTEAAVIYHRHVGCGLFFQDFKIDALQAIHDLLHAA